MTKKSSLRLELGRSLLFFGIAMIIVLGIFQFFLLEPMYEKNKINQIISNAKDAEEDFIENDGDVSYLNSDSSLFSKPSQNSDRLNEDLIHKQLDLNSCLAYVYHDDTKTYALSSNAMGCNFIHYDSVKVMENIEGLNETKKSNLEIFSNDFMHHNSPHRSILYTKMIDGYDHYYIVALSGISPIDATIETLKSQLILISIILIVSLIVLTYTLYRRIARPLQLITNAAKELPQGKYIEQAEANKYLEAQELNHTLSQAAEDIQKADRAKRDLIANVSHDLRTPLTMITGYGEMMLDIPEEKTDENIRVVVDESKRLTNLVNDLLDLSKLNDKKIILNPSYFDLTEMIREQLMKYDVYRTQKGFTIDIYLADSVYVKADRSRIQQVLNNFISNAIHYSGENKHIIIREIISDKDVQVQVQDYGKGIREEDIPYIWDRYYKVDKTHQRTDGGSGLGLAIVKEILDLHHFRYGVTSKIDEGSTFYFSIPIEKDLQSNNLGSNKG
ncbi:MAG: hypothetical protein IJ875_06255 [Solobacterium sp.]|nr:hypothetical protein [Solobacterium sp.]